MVIAASLSLADIPGTIRLWKQRRTEFWLSIAAFLGVAILGVLPGIGIAVVLSILNVFRRAWWPYQATLGRVDGLPGYHDTTVVSRRRAHGRPRDLPLRRSADLRERAHVPRRGRGARQHRPNLRWIVVAAEPITDVDTTAADMLEELDEELNARGISLVFAEMKDPVRRKIERYELTRTIDPGHFYPTLEAAITAFQAETGRTWKPPGGDRSMTNGSAPNARRRVAALAAIALLVLALISVALGTLSNLGALLVGLVAIFGVVVGGWYVVSRRGGVRLIAFGVLVASLVLLVSTLFIGDPEWAGIVTGAVLGAMSVGAARYALHGTKQERSQPLANEEAAPPARRPVLLMNPKSGGGKAEKFKLVEECEKRGIEAIVLQQGDDLLELAEDAVARGADVIGMAGGDGSQALVSSVASAHDIPHVVIPAGTRNHFALDLGLDRNDVVGALDAYADGVERRIDLADVNGRIFVNNASLGLYAKIVQSEEYRDAKRQTAADMLPSMLGPDARTARPALHRARRRRGAVGSPDPGVERSV